MMLMKFLLIVDIRNKNLCGVWGWGVAAFSH